MIQETRSKRDFSKDSALDTCLLTVLSAIPIRCAISLWLRCSFLLNRKTSRILEGSACISALIKYVNCFSLIKWSGCDGSAINADNDSTYFSSTPLCKK